MIHLLTEFYTPSSDERSREINACLLHNLKNPQICQITTFIEPATVDSMRLLKNKYGPDTLTFLNVVILPTRPTYATMIAYASDAYDKNKHFEITVIANSDIYFDYKNLYPLFDFFKIKPQIALALSRYNVIQKVPDVFSHEFMLKGSETAVIPNDCKHSQDTWIYSSRNQSLLKHPEHLNFTLGKLNCDNRLARIFIDAGFLVLNPVFHLKTYHLHYSAFRLDSNNEQLRIPGTYAYILPLAKSIPFPDAYSDYKFAFNKVELDLEEHR
jgi:hypothetical protein